MLKRVQKVLEWIGHIETIHTIIQAEFFRTLFWPTVATVTTALSGWLGGVPLMWIVMATALTFMAVSAGMLTASMYLERKNPLNKLQITKTLFNYDLVPITPPNRHQERATPKRGTPAVPAFRHFVHGQLGIEILNRASFPISIIVEDAQTEIEGVEPPRVKYPRPPTIIHPHTTMWVHDGRIDMKNSVCDDLDGKMDIKIKYGLPGEEQFDLTQKGTVEVFMEPFGYLKGVYFHPIDLS